MTNKPFRHLMFLSCAQWVGSPIPLVCPMDSYCMFMKFYRHLPLLPQLIVLLQVVATVNSLPIKLHKPTIAKLRVCVNLFMGHVSGFGDPTHCACAHDRNMKCRNGLQPLYTKLFRPIIILKCSSKILSCCARQN